MIIKSYRQLRVNYVKTNKELKKIYSLTFLNEEPNKNSRL